MNETIMRKKKYGNNYGEIKPLAISALRTEEKSVMGALISDEM